MAKKAFWRDFNVQLLRFAQNLEMFNLTGFKVVTILLRYNKMSGGCRHADMQTCRHAYMHTCIHADMQTCRHADTQTYRLADMQACRHADINNSNKW
jgi:hypothetical protein